MRFKKVVMPFKEKTTKCAITLGKVWKENGIRDKAILLYRHKNKILRRILYDVPVERNIIRKRVRTFINIKEINTNERNRVCRVC